MKRIDTQAFYSEIGQDGYLVVARHAIMLPHFFLTSVYTASAHAEWTRLLNGFEREKYSHGCGLRLVWWRRFKVALCGCCPGLEHRSPVQTAQPGTHAAAIRL